MSLERIAMLDPEAAGKAGNKFLRAAVEALRRGADRADVERELLAAIHKPARKPESLPAQLLAEWAETAAGPAATRAEARLMREMRKAQVARVAESQEHGSRAGAARRIFERYAACYMKAWDLIAWARGYASLEESSYRPRVPRATRRQLDLLATRLREGYEEGMLLEVPEGMLWSLYHLRIDEDEAPRISVEAIFRVTSAMDQITHLSGLARSHPPALVRRFRGSPLDPDPPEVRAPNASWVRLGVGETLKAIAAGFRRCSADGALEEFAVEVEELGRFEMVGDLQACQEALTDVARRAMDAAIPQIWEPAALARIKSEIWEAAAWYPEEHRIEYARNLLRTRARAALTLPRFDVVGD